jgi:hypothetical protein
VPDYPSGAGEALVTLVAEVERARRHVKNAQGYLDRMERGYAAGPLQEATDILRRADLWIALREEIDGVAEEVCRAELDLRELSDTPEPV